MLSFWEVQGLEACRSQVLSEGNGKVVFDTI